MSRFSTSPPPPFGRRLLAFIDLLGWGDRTRSIVDEKDLRGPLNVMRSVEIAAEQEEKRKAQFAKHGLAIGQSIRSSYFSDTITYSCAADDEAVPWVSFLVSLTCSTLLENGFYTRGAITVGDLLHDSTRIMGEALVRAADLEKTVAMYPRLVVSDEAESLLVSPGPPGAPLGPSQVRVDHDGLKYFDIYPTWNAGVRTQHIHDEAVRARAVVQRDVDNTRDLSNLSSKQKVQTLKHRAAYGWSLRYLDGVIADPIDPEYPASG